MTAQRDKERKRFCSRSCNVRWQHANGSFPPRARRDASPRWRGGRTIATNGYVMVLVDGRYVGEHRLVMEKMLGRPLVRGENVHHLNGDRADNRLENLELWGRPQPTGVRRRDVPHCPTCTCGQ